MADFALTVGFDDGTRSFVNLYVAKVVQTTLAGAGLVWARVPLSGLSLTLRWQSSQVAYCGADTKFGAGTMIDPGNTIPIDVGCTWTTGAPTTQRTGDAHVIEILNGGRDVCIAGLAQPIGTAPDPPAVPYCVFRLSPRMQIALKPVEKVILTFSTGTYAPQTILGRRAEDTPQPAHRAPFAMIQPDQPDASSETVIIDMRGAENNSRSVSFSSTNGWSCAQETWAVVLPASEPIGAHTIEAPERGQP